MSLQHVFDFCGSDVVVAISAREIVVDIRRREIEPHPAPNINKMVPGIHRYKTDQGEDILDLDGSVFMNFQRYTKQNIMDCLKADMA